MKVAKRVNLKSLITKRKKNGDRFRLTTVITSQYIQIPNDYVVHLKLIYYANYITIKTLIKKLML